MTTQEDKKNNNYQLWEHGKRCKCISHHVILKDHMSQSLAQKILKAKKNKDMVKYIINSLDKNKKNNKKAKEYYIRIQGEPIYEIYTLYKNEKNMIKKMYNKKDAEIFVNELQKSCGKQKINMNIGFDIIMHDRKEDDEEYIDDENDDEMNEAISVITIQLLASFLYNNSNNSNTNL